VLAARGQEWNVAAENWVAAREAGLATPWLQRNIGELFHRLAEERLQEGDVKGAFAAAEEASGYKLEDKQLDALFSQLYERRADQAASSGEWDEALEDWERAAEVGGSNFRLAYNRALALEHHEEYAEAGKAWREALRRRPRRADHPDAISDEQVARLWRRAAEAYHMAGDYEEAANVYRQALKWNPDDIPTRLALAQGLEDDGRLQAAENELGRVLERDPDNITAHLRLGELLAEYGHWWTQSAAIPHWERVLELDPKNAEARAMLTEFYLDAANEVAAWGNLVVAFERLHKALEYTPGDGRVLVAMARCHFAAGSASEAEAYIEQALHSARGDIEVYGHIISTWLLADEPGRAWDVVTQAEGVEGSLPFQFFIHRAAFCIEHLGQEQARPWLERAVERAPADQPVFMIIGEMAVVNGAGDIAREFLERAIERGQHPGQAHMMLGLLAAMEGDLRDANREWNRALGIARRAGDVELQTRVEYSRAIFSMPAGMRDALLANPWTDVGDLFGWGDDDLWEEDDDDEFSGYP